jgi:hypothetical protein
MIHRMGHAVKDRTLERGVIGEFAAVPAMQKVGRLIEGR